jgi:hypothetical protein
MAIDGWIRDICGCHRREEGTAAQANLCELNVPLLGIRKKSQIHSNFLLA